MNNSSLKGKILDLVFALVFILLGATAMFFYQSQKEVTFSEDINIEYFNEVKDLMDERFTFDHPSGKDKTNALISGYVDSFNDDFSAYLDSESASIFNEDASGEFGGAGMEIGISNGLLQVISPLKGSPAEKAGVRSGDYIIEIDSVDIAGMSFEQVIGLIRGEVGTKLSMKLYRAEESTESLVELTRDIIQIPTINTKEIDGVFIIELYSFNDMSVDLFKKALQDFADSDHSKLLVDVRDNPGGFLDSVNDIASYFLGQGKTIVVEDFGKEKFEKYRSKGHTLLSQKEFDLAILQNQGSASASEILSAALKDHSVATILGEQSYGKGSVQEYIDLTGGAALKVTIAKWLSPNKNEINKLGVIPDVEIFQTESTELDFDPQQTEAINYLNKN